MTYKELAAHFTAQKGLAIDSGLDPIGWVMSWDHFEVLAKDQRGFKSGLIAMQDNSYTVMGLTVHFDSVPKPRLVIDELRRME